MEKTQSIDVRLNSIEVAKQETEDGLRKGLLGATSSSLVLTRHTWSAPIVATGTMVQYTKVTVVSLYKALSAWLLENNTEDAKKQVGGPIAMVYVVRRAASHSWQLVLMIIALISISLAVMNSLPIPALDGGRLVLTLVFNKIFKRPVDEKTERLLVGFSFASLVLLMILVIFLDINRFFTGSG